MSMIQKIEIDGKQVPFKASAAIPCIYRIKFHRDIYKDLDVLGKAVGNGDEGSSHLDMFSNPLSANLKNSRVAGLVVTLFHFPKIIPKCLTSNPLPQIVTSNQRLQPDIHFAVDMFPYKKTELFQKSGFKSKPPKKPGNTLLSGFYLSFLDIKTTVSQCMLHPNISTPLTFLSSYSYSQRYSRSLASVALSQLT